MRADILAALIRGQEHGVGMVLATRLPDGLQFVMPDDVAPAALRDAAHTALERDQSSVAILSGERWFLHVHAPSHRLLIVGAVHIAQSLAPLAALVGLSVTIIDPRRGFASEDRFPGVSLIHSWPDEALAKLKPDHRTAIVTLTHDPKIDDLALDFALRGTAFFIGALGSRKTHAGRLERLGALGHARTSLARIRGPVGLPLGAVTAPEIALSIVAEIVAVRRGAAPAER